MDFSGKLSMETTAGAAGQMVGGEVDDGDGGGPSPTAAAARHRSTPPGDYFDGSLEPMMRCRANTWPCRPDSSSSAAADDENRSAPTSVDGVQSDGRGDPTLGGATTAAAPPPGAALPGGATRKAAARRNAWGNLSYADLITRAIESSPEKRLTLSQIYGWMVENVPFFKDKGDSNSSAGWKNSIRHNLSLHSRFMRVQNESTGKSSWWVINPDVKHLKTPRRRAATMDNTKMPLQLRRTRLKGGGLTRVVSAERPLMAFAYDGSSDHLEAAGCEHLSADVLGLASQNYRMRSSSNASSIGRLSPIPATAEPDVSNFRYGMPLAVPTWKNICLPSENCTETLSESLASIFVEDAKKPMLIGDASCRGNIMIPNSSILTSRGGIMASNVTTVHNQNGGNIVAQNGCDQVGPNRNHIGLNGGMLGMHSYSQSAVGRESPGGVQRPLSHHMWPVYHHHQSNGVYPSSSNSVAGDAHDKRHMYDMETEFSMSPSFSASDVLYYGDGQSRLSGNLCRSASEVGFSQYGVSSVNGPAPQYSNSAVNQLIKQEPESSSCYYAGSSGDPKAEMSGSGIMMGMVMPMTSTVKVENPSGPFPSESPGGISNWQDQQQQQQQQSPRQPSAGHSLGSIDPRKLMKILAEKPHLKEKMLQLIQQKRQQLNQQCHGYTTAATVPRPVDPLRSKQTLTNNENCAGHRSPARSTALHSPDSSMPVDLDLDFDTTLAINCDIDQVLQHEMNFGELDFGMDHLQVKLSGSDMDYNSFGF